MLLCRLRDTKLELIERQMVVRALRGAKTPVRTLLRVKKTLNFLELNRDELLAACETLFTVRSTERTDKGFYRCSIGRCEVPSANQVKLLCEQVTAKVDEGQRLWRTTCAMGPAAFGLFLDRDTGMPRDLASLCASFLPDPRL